MRQATGVRGAGFQLVGHNVIVGEQELDATLFRVCLDASGLGQLVVFDQRAADRDAARLEERVSHRAADQNRVRLLEQAVNDLDFVRAAEAACVLAPRDICSELTLTCWLPAATLRTTTSTCKIFSVLTIISRSLIIFMK